MLGLFTLFASWPERLGKRQRPQPSRDWGNDDPRLLAAMNDPLHGWRDML
jgi:hypothetical protein